MSNQYSPQIMEKSVSNQLSETLEPYPGQIWANSLNNRNKIQDGSCSIAKLVFLVLVSRLHRTSINTLFKANAGTQKNEVLGLHREWAVSALVLDTNALTIPEGRV